MNHRWANFIGILWVTVVAWTGCRNDLGDVADFEMLDQDAAQRMTGAILEYSEMGVPSHRLRAGTMERSSEEEAVWTVGEGFVLDVLAKDGAGSAALSADRGTFEETSRFLKAEGNVQLVGEGGDTLLTELLYWSADSDRVHTPAAVEVLTPTGVLRGTGLESDARFERYTILQPTGTFLIDTTRSSAP